MSRSRGRRKHVPPRRGRSWLQRLSPEVRVIGLVAVISAIIAAIIFWPWKEAKGPRTLVVAVPADPAMRLALIDAQRDFARAHRNIDVVLVEAQPAKLRAYEAMWRKGKSGVDLLVGAEGELQRWAEAGLLESWDGFLAERQVRLAHAGLEAGTVAGSQVMLPVALDLTCVRAAGQGAMPPPGTLRQLTAAAHKLSTTGRPALGADWSDEWTAAVILSTANAARPQLSAAMLLGHVGEALAWWRRGLTAGWASAPAAPGAARPPLLWAGQRGWVKGASTGAAGLWLPPGAQEHGTTCLAYGALLPKASKNKDAARVFAGELLLSDRFQTALAQTSGLLPARTSTWAKLEGPQWGALRSAGARAIALPPRLRSRAQAQRFAHITALCLKGEMDPDAAAAQLAAVGR